MASTPKAGVSAASAYVVPERTQLAALCWRPAKAGGREILLVTSSNGRWILPKGWPMSGKSDGKAALTEAWEEAGVEKGKVSRKPLGKFIGLKVTTSGDEFPCTTHVYSVKVAQCADDWPEKDRRDRRWVSPEEASRIVAEDGLREILIKF